MKCLTHLGGKKRADNLSGRSSYEKKRWMTSWKINSRLLTTPQIPVVSTWMYINLTLQPTVYFTRLMGEFNDYHQSINCLLSNTMIAGSSITRSRSRSHVFSFCFLLNWSIDWIAENNGGGEGKIFSFFFLSYDDKNRYTVSNTHTDIYTLGYRMNGAASFVSYGINKRVRLAFDTPVIRRMVVVFFLFSKVGWGFLCILNRVK